MWIRIEVRDLLYKAIAVVDEVAIGIWADGFYFCNVNMCSLAFCFAVDILCYV